MKFLLILSIILMSGCADHQNNGIAKSLNQGEEENLVRYEDLERGVTCYRIRGYSGISCMNEKEK